MRRQSAAAAEVQTGTASAGRPLQRRRRQWHQQQWRLTSLGLPSAAATAASRVTLTGTMQTGACAAASRRRRAAVRCYELL